MDYTTAVGYTLRRVRKEKRLSLRQVSYKCFVRFNHISDIERATKQTTTGTLDIIVTKGLGMDMEEFLKETYLTYKGKETNE